MANPDLSNPAERLKIVQGIKSEDNLSRKREHQKRFDVYRERQDRYILERLEREFDIKTVQNMRKIFSINLTKRIVDEMSSIYNVAPNRNFASLSQRELTDNEQSQVQALYEECQVNVALRQSNRYYNLHDQCAIMVVPDMKGGIRVRAIPPLHYDVIPQFDDQETAWAYVLNVWDYDLNKTARDEGLERTQLNRYRSRDDLNQAIADDDDRKAMQERYIVWTADAHFTMNGKGDIVGEPVENPIGRLPFIDVATEKDFQFFVRRGTSVVDFGLDYGLLLSDMSNIIRLQSYSQAIVSSVKQPQDMTIGPDKVIWLPKDPNNPDNKAEFEFASPSPDLSGSQDFLEMTLRLFLSTKGVDPGTVSGKGESKSFSSGVERLLAMLDKFEATRSDFDVFKGVEMELFDLLKSWSNAFQTVTGEGQLMPTLKNGTLGEDLFLDVQFNQPMAVQTQVEKEDSVIKLLDQGLLSRKEAIMELREVSEETAEQILIEIDESEPEPEPEIPPMLPPTPPEEEGQDGENRQGPEPDA
jgi:hypothetical protein